MMSCRQEMAQKSTDEVIYALHQAGLPDSQIKELNVIEVGSGVYISYPLRRK